MFDKSHSFTDEMSEHHEECPTTIWSSDAMENQIMQKGYLHSVNSIF